uniref:Uncharacterized protein n=1 Tax=Siphoviridae sp. ctqSm5 TaxID=2827949 RepID=A0A8S5SPM3_9CAUD|nr:MAG TPA: hypothetical protein [Siphoviridae sp. ctqSm5]
MVSPSLSPMCILLPKAETRRFLLNPIGSIV